jgi:hypothetical protein
LQLIQPRRANLLSSPLPRHSSSSHLSLTVDTIEQVGHEANGFGRRYLHEWEACTLYEAEYMALQDDPEGFRG